MLSSRGSGVASAHRSSILHHPKPQTVKDTLSFLELVNYSRSFIPDYAQHTHHLRQMVNVQGLRNLHDDLEWTPEGEKAFITIKQLLSQAAVSQDVSEKAHSMATVLFQKKGGERLKYMYVNIYTVYV